MLILNSEQLRAAYESLETIIGKTAVADGITTSIKENGWCQVIDGLKRLSIQDARKIGEGHRVQKNGYELLPEQWVHARFLVIIVDLSTWMGKQWESHGLGQKEDFLKRILSG